MNPWNTLRIAARTWRRAPTLAAVIVVTLTLGVGATTTALAIAYSMLVQRLPFPDADRLVWVTTYDTRTESGQAAVIGSNRLPQFADWQEHLTSFEQLGAWAGDAPDVFTVTGGSTPERVSGLRVTHQLLDMLGATLVTGRLFRAGDDVPDTAQTAVLSYGFWQRRFAGAPVVGQSITIENEPHTIVGVVPTEFPLSGSLFASAPIDVYLPLAVDGNEDIGGFMAVVGRLRPGVTADQARAELASRQTALSIGKWEWMQVLGQSVTPLRDLVTRDARLPVLLLLAGAAGVLLLACANLVNLLLVRASGRRREMQLRMALGASMRQVLAQLTIENGVLVGISGVIGVWFTVAVLALLQRAASVSIARIGDLHAGGVTIASAVAICAAITIVFGGVAALQLRRRDMTDALRPHAGITIDRRGAYVQRTALAIQAAVVIVLTVAGGLLVRSLAELLDVDPGFNPRGAMAIRVDPAGRLAGPARLPFFDRVLESVRAVPAVQSAALTIHVPMGDRPSMGWDAIPEGRAYNPVTDNAVGRIVSPGYFGTIGVRIVAGRDFDASDVRARPFVMAINETFARRIRAEGGDPLRSRFTVLGNVRQVVAVVSDVKHRGLDGEAGHEAYIPMGQAPGFFQAYDLVVRASDPIALVPSIRSAIWAIDSNQALGTPVALEEYISRTLRPRRVVTVVIGVFAGTTLLLAVLGVYGVVRYRVAQQVKEIAIRIALGSPGWRVTVAVLGDTLACVSVGLAAGLVLAVGAASIIRRYLFGVEPRDGVTLVAACALVLTAALLAAYLPARRAPRVNPGAALRAE
ncbi:MAG TPA: ADOP family duplicated permease [Vicinamibacterales bacterium]|nr:ADOP family duplicated permease [Vicinamibacterales bacterium]